ncbi:sulfurtransferase TusA family protein [Candidatus Zinderia endosymbiont of Aphrophora alni]|uniref:sulfurtransferase TusA family protein n=1 Tax=Candidatus Zinderia endosymbiont of Aphrophora alni TaxID=3077951 RepID=UPI0030D3FD84
MKIKKKVNTCYLKCPLPILKTKKELSKIKKKEILLIITTDINSKIDFEIFTKQTKHILKIFFKEKKFFFFFIEHK